jgi:hypothetical protein
MSIREYEANNVTLPFKNSTGMRAIANIPVSNAGIVQNLASLFRGIQDGHYVTPQADGAKIYVAFGSNDVGQTLAIGLTGFGIDANAVGTAPNVCFPIPDGVMLPGVPYGGAEVGSTNTRAPTMVAGYNFVHARVASGGVATAFLRLYRSSLAPGQNPGQEFKPAT